MPAGDLLSLMPSFKKLWEDTGRKAVIYQRVNLSYGDMYGAYAGATYSIKNGDGVPVTMNRAVFDALKPLLDHQEYIENFMEWKGEDVEYDMDLLRQMDTTMPWGAINRWPFYLWPEMACDLSSPWLNVVAEGAKYKNCILVNRTERYNNMLVSYNFLKKYGGMVLFVGLPDEHMKFNAQHGLNITGIEAHDFRQVAVAMKNCKLFIGNQSACFQIAEGLKVPRLLECCKQLPNVIGNGTGFYDFLNQRSLEYYVNKLYHG